MEINDEFKEDIESFLAAVVYILENRNDEEEIDLGTVAGFHDPIKNADSYLAREAKILLFKLKGVPEELKN